MKEILIVGKPENEISHLRSTLSQQMPDYKIRFSKAHKESIQQHLNNQTKMAILNFDQLPQNSAEPVQSLRKIGFDEPLLMLANVNNPQLLEKIKYEKDTLVMPKPFDVESIMPLAQKMIDREPLEQRKYPRFNVNETVALEAFGISGKIGAQMTTMSKGGALLKLSGHEKLHIGDIIQVHIPLREIGKFHLVHAQIMSAEAGKQIFTGESFGISWEQFAAVKKIAA